MASGNLVLGTLRGKLGDVVAYRSLGQQRARVRVRNVKNPRSILQVQQRLVLACAAKTVTVLDPIVNHSWQSIKYGADSKRYARKQIMKVLRDQMVAAYNAEGIGEATEVGCFPSFAAGAAVAAYPISQGSLPSLLCEVVATEGEHRGGHLSNAVEITNTVTPAQFCEALGVSTDTQLTFVFLTPKRVTAEDATPAFFNGDLRYARINFLASAVNEAMFQAVTGEEGLFTIKAAVLDADRSTLAGNLLFDANNEAIVFNYEGIATTNGNSVGGFTVIASKYADGAWQRSSQRLAVGYPVAVATAPTAQPYVGYNFYEDLMDAEIEAKAVAEDRYLNKEKN